MLLGLNNQQQTCFSSTLFYPPCPPAHPAKVLVLTRPPLLANVGQKCNAGLQQLK